MAIALVASQHKATTSRFDRRGGAQNFVEWSNGDRIVAGLGKVAAVSIYSIVPDVARFSHEEAMEVYQLAMERPQTPQIVVDLRRAVDATTSGFARLVLLRKTLRAEGRDLCVANLRQRAQRVYQVNRLHDVLPEVQSAN